MAKSIVGDIFSAFGITGSGATPNTLAPASKSPEADRVADLRFRNDSLIEDPNVWQYYSNRMTMPRSLDEMMRLWDEMCNWDLMAAALVEIVDETIQQDQGTGKALWFECSDERVEDELNGMLERLSVEEKLPSQIWHLAGYGNHFEKILYERGDGVQGLSFCHPMDVRRYWLSKNRRCVGFRWAREKPDKDTIWQQGNTAVSRVAFAEASTRTAEDLWYPWDFMHMRRMYRLRVSEHGEPIFEEAQGIYKKLRMAIDQMVVHRAQVQPDRYVVGIDTQEQPPLEQMKTVQRWKQSLRSKQAYGNGQSTDVLSNPTDFTSYHNPLALDTIFWLPRPKGFQHTIEKLAGTPDVPDVYDIELLMNLFFSIIGMPRSWFSGGAGAEQGGGPVSGKALLAQDIRFMRKVRSLRRPVLDSYTWLGYLHLMLKGYDISNVELRTKMSDIGTLEDQLKIEIFSAQVELLTKLGDFFDKYRLSPESWLELIFKRFMRLPDELINTVLTSLPPPVSASMESQHGKPAPEQRTLIRQLTEFLRPHQASVDRIKRLSRVLYEDVQVAKRATRVTGSQPLPPSPKAKPDNYLQEASAGSANQAGRVVVELSSLTEATSQLPAEPRQDESASKAREYYRPR